MRTLTSLAAVCGVAIVLLFNPTLPPLHRVGAAPALRVSSSEEGGHIPVLSLTDAGMLERAGRV
jgi:hypothetical protein